MATDYAKVHWSSLSGEWETPQALFDELAEEFAFTLDVCATDENHKVDRYYTKEQDGLAQVWSGICWMNPPYGRGIGTWIMKAYQASQYTGATVVCLLPARTDTRWFHRFCVHGEIRFIKGRLKFGHHPNSAPFPSMIVIFRPGDVPLEPAEPIRPKCPNCGSLEYHLRDGVWCCMMCPHTDPDDGGEQAAIDAQEEQISRLETDYTGEYRRLH